MAQFKVSYRLVINGTVTVDAENETDAEDISPYVLLKHGDDYDDLEVVSVTPKE